MKRLIFTCISFFLLGLSACSSTTTNTNESTITTPSSYSYSNSSSNSNPSPPPAAKSHRRHISGDDSSSMEVPFNDTRSPSTEKTTDPTKSPSNRVGDNSLS